MKPPSSGRGAFATLRRAARGALAPGLRRVAGVVRRVTVEGSSMEPTLVPGDRLLVVPAWGLRQGEIIAVPDPRVSGRLLVKRVISVDQHLHLISVEGDNRHQSTDSRMFGPIPRRAILGRVVYRYWPASRAGPVGRVR